MAKKNRAGNVLEEFAWSDILAGEPRELGAQGVGVKTDWVKNLWDFWNGTAARSFAYSPFDLITIVSAEMLNEASA
jgi:hypothetical protein